MNTGKIYFASDFHLGLDAPNETSKERENHIVQWLDSIWDPANELYLVGDVFDYWFEYKRVIPKGFSRFIGKLAEIRDSGMHIFFLTGNHDLWMFRYFQDELNIPIFRGPLRMEILGKKFFIAHGDGIGNGDYRYQMVKRVFTNRYCQWIFERLHPNFGLKLMKSLSNMSRKHHLESEVYNGSQNERLEEFAEECSQREAIDYFILGHRHLPISVVLSNGESRYINLGDWLKYRSFAEFHNGQMTLKFFKNDGFRFLP